MPFKHCAAVSRWQESQRKSVPASMAELLEALKRLWLEAATLAELAHAAIQAHSFEPYWTFRAKIDEHAALIAVIRGRLPTMREMRGRQADAIAAAIEREEQEILILTVKASLKFCFALSAHPWLPVGARETFIHETDTLRRARAVLEQGSTDALPENLLDDLGTAQMILAEIIDKSPSLTDFTRPSAAPAEDEALGAGAAPAAAAPEQAETFSPA